jgi:hypothetical protein
MMVRRFWDVPAVARERVPARAPVGHVLSAVAAAIYLVAAFALARSARRVAFSACGLVPLVLPMLGLAWLGRTPT